MSARLHLSPYLEGLTTSEMKAAIREANLGNFETRIAELYLIEQLELVDVAAILYVDRSTVGRHTKRIRAKVESTAHKLFDKSP